MADREEAAKRTLSIILPDPTYKRVVRVSRHERFRTRNQVILECVRRALGDIEREYPSREEAVAN